MLRLAQSEEPHLEAGNQLNVCAYSKAWAAITHFRGSVLPLPPPQESKINQAGTLTPCSEKAPLSLLVGLLLEREKIMAGSCRAEVDCRQGSTMGIETGRGNAGSKRS